MPSCGARHCARLERGALVDRGANKHFTSSSTGRVKCLFPLIFEFLLLLIYALNSILNSDFEPDFLPIISFIINFVAEKVAKLSEE